MRELQERFVSDEDSALGRPKTYTHKWECFLKLRMYERMGAISDVRRWKELYEHIKDIAEHDYFIKGILRRTEK